MQINSDEKLRNWNECQVIQTDTIINDIIFNNSQTEISLFMFSKTTQISDPTIVQSNRALRKAEDATTEENQAFGIAA